MRERGHQPVGRGELQPVREHRDVGDAVHLQHMADERQEAVAHDLHADLVALRPVDDLDEGGIDAHAGHVVEQALARHAHVLDLQPQAIARRQLAFAPGVFPVAPGLVGRIALDQLVEHIALREGVVEIEEQYRLKQRSGHWRAAPEAKRRISAGVRPLRSARDRPTPGDRTASAARARASRRRRGP